MKKRVFFSMTCHQGPIQHLLTLSHCFNEKYEIRGGVNNWQTPIEEVYVALKEVDIFIYQNYHDIPESTWLSHMPEGGVCVKIPYVTSKIYWPTWAKHHPKVEGSATWDPFACTILNRLLEETNDAAAIQKKYVDLDFAQVVDLNQNFTEQIEYLKKIQKDTPLQLDLVTLIKNFYRHSAFLFHTVTHPGTAIWQYLGYQLLKFLQCDVPVVYEMPLLDFHEYLIHPSVIAHLKLEWCNESTRWNIVNHEGKTVQLKFDEALTKYIEARLAQKNKPSA